MIKKDKRIIVRAFRKQYKDAHKSEKSELLNKLVLITGYSRKHLMETLLDSSKTRKRKKRVQES